MLTTRQARDMVKVALQNKAPKMYEELQGDGSLNQFVEDRANEMLEFVADQMDRALTKTARNPNLGYLKSVQHLTAARMSAEEQAIATFLEFEV